MRYQFEPTKQFLDAVARLVPSAQPAAVAAARVIGGSVARRHETSAANPAPRSTVYSHDFECDIGTLRVLSALGFRSQRYWALAIDVLQVPDSAAATPWAVTDAAQAVWDAWRPPGTAS